MLRNRGNLIRHEG